MFNSYLQKVFSKAKTGEASERTYYSVLEELLTNFKEGSRIMIEARKSSVGIPDFKVQTDKDLLVGYVEAKDLGRDLDHLSRTEHDQIEKYRKEYPKLMVTNYIEFRLYENTELVDSVTITQPVTVRLGIPALDNEGHAKGLFERFFSTTIPQVYTDKKLSELLAHKTRVLRGLIREEIDLTDNTQSETEKLLETFQQTLKPDMTPEIFSDMYAQTITFGLFVARINSDHEKFDRFTAHSLIPHTIPLLKKVFWILSGTDVPQHIEWQVDEIAEILANTNIQKITEEFFSHGKGRDPIIHFYETFLSEYDSSQREQLGVYYTPQPVVSYIARSLNKILKKHFHKSEGFADTSVITLDPAAGTLTFPAEAITIAKHEFESSHGSGGWDRLVKTHILKDFYAFEILMAPYAVGHLKISLLLKELGYQMEQDERFELYLTNTLDMSKFHPQKTMLSEEISQESEKAFEIKDKVPVLVVMGNPPYSGHSSNKGDWIEKQIEHYKKVDGKPLGEKNPKWLNDDYVKFIRFAQWKIEKTGQGILGFITNHAWLDNPTFRGMRDSLMNSFDEIYILNLHGSALKKEKVPEDIQAKEKVGERDEGVFGIRPGTSITLAVKNSESTGDCKVYYSEQWGLRAKKFEWLDRHDLENTDWIVLSPNKPSYFFVQKNEEVWNIYKNFISLIDIFPLNSIGIQSHRDNLVVDLDKEILIRKFRMIWNSDLSDKMLLDSLEVKDTDTWKINEKRNIKIVGENWEDSILPVLYRPFDTRWMFYHKEFVDRQRNAVMGHMVDGDNLMLLVPRSVGDLWGHAFVSNSLAVDVAISARSREANQSFPLYLHSEMKHQGSMFDDGETRQNINWDILPKWVRTLKPFISTVTNKPIQIPEAVFYYIYAILYSDTYRESYQEFLKSDFPRIPFTNDIKIFEKLAILGEQLVELHLLKSKLLDNLVSRYEGKGDDRVEKRDYQIDKERIYINNRQYFDQIPRSVWDYYIGGYQVLDKWIKDRVGKILSLDDQTHFRKIITSIIKTMETQKKIDEIYPTVETSTN
jgi:predicted helicase